MPANYVRILCPNLVLLHSIAKCKSIVKLESVMQINGS